ncbi:MAG: alpha/beta fold hydrolase [Flavobacterium sp.]
MRKRKKAITTIPKFIVLIFSILMKISTRLTTLLAVKLFSTPIKYKMPKRELDYYNQSKKYFIEIPAIEKKIRIFEYGNFEKKVLLVHGWSGRGTQLNKIAEKLNSLGYTCISFDAPAHGKSEGKSTLMVEFVACILEIEKKYQIEYAIGHSLGGMSVLRAMYEGLKVKKAVVIGIGDLIEDIVKDFVEKLQLDLKYVQLINDNFEQKFGLKMNDYSSSNSVKNIEEPILIIHDEDDLDIPISCAYSIAKNSKNGFLLVTKKLGHRKILSSEKVIEEIVEFIKK